MLQTRWCINSLFGHVTRVINWNREFLTRCNESIFTTRTWELVAKRGCRISILGDFQILPGQRPAGGCTTWPLPLIARTEKNQLNRGWVPNKGGDSSYMVQVRWALGTFCYWLFWIIEAMWALVWMGSQKRSVRSYIWKQNLAQESSELPAFEDKH